MTPLQSSQNFARALKAASDPPTPDGPTKIQIARQAWDDISFYVPNKAELIVDWLLTKLLKDKGKERSQNPIADARYWALLSDILCSTDSLLTITNSRPLKSWLTPLLHRITIAPIVTSLLNLLKGLPMEEQARLPSIVVPSFTILWPIGSQKMSTEQLLECWGLSLDVLTTFHVNPDIVKIGQLITKSYRHSFGNSSSKKKIYTTFLQSHLQHWLQCVTISSAAEYYQAFVDDVLNAGFDVIFSIDILRQERDGKMESSLFDTLEGLLGSCKGTVLTVLPQLFPAYLRTLKKYRGTLFSQGSNKPTSSVIDELHSAGMNFFMSCQALIGNGKDKQKWESMAKLLSIVEQENLFHRQQIDSGVAFTQIIESIISVLNTARKVEQLDITTVVVECLTVIARIDYDLILPTIARILPRILLIPKPNPEYFMFLEVVLEYHSKTRTINTYISSLFDVLAPRHIGSVNANPRKTYESCFSGPLLHATHLKQLSKALQTFLTLSQCIPTVSSVLESLSVSLETYCAAEKHSEADNGEGSRKKRKKEAGVDSAQDPEIMAISLSLIARLSSTVLSSLPTQTLLPASLEEVQKQITNFRENTLESFQKKCIKIVKDTGRGDVWSAQVVSTAILRLQYALAVSRPLRLPAYDDHKIVVKLSGLLDNDAILPELAIEIFRKLFYRCSPDDETNAQATFDKALSFLETNFQATGVAWSGQSYALTFGKEGKSQGALSLLHMILERWLPIVELLASTAQLERLVKIIMLVKLSPSEPVTQELSAPVLVMRALHCAEFWEMHKLRVVFLSYLAVATAILESKNIKKLPASQISDAIAAYRLLLLFPTDYFTRNSRADFVKRALSANHLISSWKPGKEYSLTFISDALTTLRTFIKRVFVHAGAVEQLSNQQIADSLGQVCAEEEVSEGEQYTQITLDLSELYLLGLLKASQANHPEGLLKVLSSFSQYELFQTKPTIRTGIFARLIQLLTAQFTSTSFSEDVISALKVLHSHLFGTLHPRICALVMSNAASFANSSDCSDLLFGWAHLLSFGSWLGVEKGPFFGQRLAAMLISDSSLGSELDSTRITIFSIILKEKEYLKDDMTRLDIVAAAYIAFAGVLQTDRREELDAHLTQTTRNLSPAEFGHLLTLVSESLRSGVPEDQLQCLVHLAINLLCDHPQNALKYIQTFTAECLGAFVDSPIFTTGPASLRLEVLELITQHCSERPAALRSIDIGGIWTLFSQLLTPSYDHDDTTSPQIFHKLTATISSLIRLRRDLLISTLPHLGMILRQLVLATRSCRLQLGSKQLKIVADTLPRWINPTRSLGVEEGRALSRLLEGLTAKTLIRSHTAPEMQKAESLARPFSKHAAYVLKAYIEGMNDPLCILPLELRKELQPGLYALCDMMTDHSRDAMMVSALDSGGKATLKVLWKEYDKQKYVGKG